MRVNYVTLSRDVWLGGHSEADIEPSTQQSQKIQIQEKGSNLLLTNFKK